MADWNGNEYAVMNLQTLKENIAAYASYADGSGYSPIYEKTEAAQQALQELIDTIISESGKEK